MVSHSASFQVESDIQECHENQRIWNYCLKVAIAVCHAVAILEEDICCILGHLPREISKEHFFC